MEIITMQSVFIISKELRETLDLMQVKRLNMQEIVYVKRVLKNIFLRGKVTYNYQRKFNLPPHLPMQVKLGTGKLENFFTDLNVGIFKTWTLKMMIRYSVGKLIELAIDDQ